MPQDNLHRMVRLAEEFFDTKGDPEQLSVTEEVMEKLRSLHPASMGEETDGNGPIAWMLVIPTTHDLMGQFIEKEINERELLDRTPVGGTYDAIYLCSALVLPEFRGRGLARRLVTRAIRSICEEHPIRDLFVWTFSVEGKKLARSVALEFNLPLHERAP